MSHSVWKEDYKPFTRFYLTSKLKYLYIFNGDLKKNDTNTEDGQYNQKDSGNNIVFQQKQDHPLEVWTLPVMTISIEGRKEFIYAWQPDGTLQ